MAIDDTYISASLCWAATLPLFDHFRVQLHGWHLKSLKVNSTVRNVMCSAGESFYGRYVCMQYMQGAVKFSVLAN